MSPSKNQARRLFEGEGRGVNCCLELEVSDSRLVKLAMNKAPTSEELSSRLQLAIRAGKEAGNLTLKYFGQDNFSVERKADASPVTIADRSAEELLRERILSAFPGD